MLTRCSSGDIERCRNTVSSAGERPPRKRMSRWFESSTVNLLARNSQIGTGRRIQTPPTRGVCHCAPQTTVATLRDSRVWLLREAHNLQAPVQIRFPHLHSICSVVYNESVANPSRHVLTRYGPPNTKAPVDFHRGLCVLYAYLSTLLLPRFICR